MPAMARLNVGVLGLSHDHVWANLAAVAAGAHGRLGAVAEPDAQLRERFQKLHGGVATHETFEALLERRDLDAVIVFSDNRTSAELGVRALGRGLPVMIEKPMAADLAAKAQAKGADFAKLAREQSEQKETAAKGGDLGWLNPGDTVPIFEEAMGKLADRAGPKRMWVFGAASQDTAPFCFIVGGWPARPCAARAARRSIFRARIPRSSCW